MRFPWSRRDPDNTDQINRVETNEMKAERQLVRAHELSHEATKVTNALQATRLRNHFGESVEASFALRRRRPRWGR